MMDATSVFKFAGEPVIQTSRYQNGSLRVNVWDDEGPVSTLSVNVDAKIDPNHQFVLNHDVPLCLLNWMQQSGRFVVDFDRLVGYGYVEGQPVVTMREANNG